MMTGFAKSMRGIFSGATKRPSHANVNQRVEELRRLSRPVWVALGIGFVSLFLMISVLSVAMDRNTLKTSEQILGSLLEERATNLASLLLEFGYWDQAVENVVYAYNDAWIEENFVEYFHESLHLSGFLIFDGENVPIMNVIEDKTAKEPAEIRYGSALSALVEKARTTRKASAPNPATGFIGRGEQIYLASAIQMTTYNSVADISTDHVMVFVRRVDWRYLNYIAKTYKLDGLSITAAQPGILNAALPIVLADGSRVGFFAWNPKLLAISILPWILSAVAISALVMAAAARIFLQRAQQTVNALDTARRQAESAKKILKEQAMRDPLTGLGNRRAFENHLAKANQRLTGHKQVSVLAIDLDRFKQINDELGHEAGDKVLIHVAETLQACLAARGSTFRLGGDEFLVVLKEESRYEVLDIGQRIVDSLSRPLEIGDETCRFGASIGVSFASDPKRLLREADIALYAAKNAGRSRVCEYKPEMDGRSTEAGRSAA